MLTIIESGPTAWALAATNGELRLYRREQPDEWHEVSLGESEPIDQDGSSILEAHYEQHIGQEQLGDEELDTDEEDPEAEEQEFEEEDPEAEEFEEEDPEAEEQEFEEEDPEAEEQDLEEEEDPEAEEQDLEEQDDDDRPRRGRRRTRAKGR